jgi:DNA repair exonuclease SbcCD ATPase subunit
MSSGLMSRFLRFLAVLSLGALLVRGEGADDAYIRIYNLLQQADANSGAGRLNEAREGYNEARRGLLALQQNFPRWNDRVVNFRLRYVTEKLASLKDLPNTAATASAPTNAPTPATAELAPNGEVLAQFEQLNGQIRRLADEKQRLEAKLREALTAQPAPVDPREFQAAIEKITSLQSTNKVLVQQLETQEAERRNLVEKVLVDEAREALNEANRKLLEQQGSVGRIEREKKEIEDRLKKLQEVTVKSLQTENTALKQQVGELKTDTDRGRQVAELAGKLSKLQTELEETKRRNEQIAAEKSALERQVEDLKARSAEEGILNIKKLEADLAAARLSASRSSAEAELIAVALNKEKQARSDLEMANKSLQGRVEELTRGLASDAESLKTLQSTLAAERAEKESIQAELKAAEEKLQALGRADGSTQAPGGASAADLASAKAEIGRLRTAMKEGAEREAALMVAVRQAEEWRGRFLREKSDLEKRLAAALAANPPAATSPPAATPSPAVAKNLARLESRVRDLEKERASLAKKVEELTKASQQGLAVTRGWRMVTPRERTEEFNRRRR